MPTTNRNSSAGFGGATSPIRRHRGAVQAVPLVSPARPAVHRGIGYVSAAARCGTGQRLTRTPVKVSPQKQSPTASLSPSLRSRAFGQCRADGARNLRSQVRGSLRLSHRPPVTATDTPHDRPCTAPSRRPGRAGPSPGAAHLGIARGPGEPAGGVAHGGAGLAHALGHERRHVSGTVCIPRRPSASSAVPVACVTWASTTRPFRFSIERCPRQASFATVPWLFPRSRQTGGTAGCSRSVPSTGVRCERCGTPPAIGHAGASPAGWSHGH